MKYHFILPLLLLASCMETPEPVRRLPREFEPTIQVPAHVSSDKLALNVFRELLRSEKGNIVYSPASMESALRLLQQGARGTSARELQALPMGEHNVPTAMSPHQATAIFVDEALPLKSGISADNIISIPLATAPAEAAERINAWVQEETRNMVPGIVSEDELKERPYRMMLANALALDEKWLHLFYEGNTDSEHPFTRADGSKCTVPMMYEKAHYRYAQGDDWQAVALFYRRDGREGNPGCFLAILPKDNARDFGTSLTEEKYSSIRRALATAKPMEFILEIPRFEQMTSTFSLRAALQACGLKHCFTEHADLSGFCDEPLMVDDILQRCYIKNCEKGTQAAAVTVISTKALCVPITPPERLTFDRPFIWAITDLTSPAAPYFMGLYEGPEGN